MTPDSPPLDQIQDSIRQLEQMVGALLDAAEDSYELSDEAAAALAAARSTAEEEYVELE